MIKLNNPYDHISIVRQRMFDDAPSTPGGQNNAGDYSNSHSKSMMSGGETRRTIGPGMMLKQEDDYEEDDDDHDEEVAGFGHDISV